VHFSPKIVYKIPENHKNNNAIKRIKSADLITTYWVRREGNLTLE